MLCGEDGGGDSPTQLLVLSEGFRNLHLEFTGMKYMAVVVWVAQPLQIGGQKSEGPGGRQQIVGLQQSGKKG